MQADERTLTLSGYGAGTDNFEFYGCANRLFFDFEE